MRQRSVPEAKSRAHAHRVRRRRVVRVAPVSPVDVPAPSDVDDEAPPAGAQTAVPPSHVDTGPDTGPRRSRLATVLASLVLAGALVALGLAGRTWYDQRQLDAARAQALAAARQTSVNFVSISARDVDADLHRIAEGATGQFKDEFTRDTAQIRSAVLENKVDSTGTVLRAAVVSVSRRSAVVLVALDATVKNTSAPDGRLSHYRIQVNLARDARTGRWLVAQLQFVG